MIKCVHDQRAQLKHNLVVVVWEHKLLEIHPLRRFLNYYSFAQWHVSFPVCWRFRYWRFWHWRFSHQRFRLWCSFAAIGWRYRPLLANSCLFQITRWRFLFCFLECNALNRLKLNTAFVRHLVFCFDSLCRVTHVAKHVDTTRLQRCLISIVID